MFIVSKSQEKTEELPSSILSETPESSQSTESASQEQLSPPTLGQPTSKKELQYPNYSKEIIISEFLPNPLGSDEAEWIEIYTSGQETVDLAGWQLDDEEDGSNPYFFPVGLLIKPGQYLVFKKEETKIALNNTKDSVRLLSLDKTLINQINYEQSQEGFSYAKGKSGNWQWTRTPTPGKENVITSLKETTKSEILLETEGPGELQKSKEKTSLQTPGVIETNLKEVRNLAKNSQVKVKGLVAVEPELLSTQYFYLAGSGLQIYMSKKDFPELRLGDWIEVTGQLSETSSGETRLKVKKKEDIRILAHQDPPTPKEVEANQIGENLEGSLITLEGEIVEITGKKIYLAEGKDEVLVYLKSPTKIESSEFKEADKIKVTGIVSQTNSGYEVLPRYQSDLEPVKILGVQTQSDTGALNLSTSQRKRETIIKYLLAFGIAIVIILAGLEIKSRAISRVLGELKAQVIKEIKKLKN